MAGKVALIAALLIAALGAAVDGRGAAAAAAEDVVAEFVRGAGGSRSNHTSTWAVLVRRRG